MENVSKVSTSFVLLGLVEMESLKHLYFFLALIVYVTILFLCTLIMYAIWTEHSLHEPMYIFIFNLVFNGSCGSTSLFPKLINDLLSGTKKVSLSICLIQTFLMQIFAGVEMFTLTIMAHDRYLAVNQPLRYPTIMTNEKAMKYIIIIWLFSTILMVIPILLTAKRPLCGQYIKSILCDNMSLVKLACGDSSVYYIVGAIFSFLLLTGCLLIIIYCYIKTFLVCLKIAKEACQKAIRTLVTHLVTFSCFFITFLFVVFRYRLNSDNLSIATHVLLTVSGVVISATLNPIIYGLRTEGLKIKVIQNLQTIAAYFQLLQKYL